MAWLRIDDGFDHHPKLLALGTDQRRYTWLRILVYTCRYRSPEIPKNITDSVPRATKKFISECIDLGLIEVTDRGTHEVHHWGDYQAGDPKKTARQRRWRDSTVDASVDGDVDASVDASVDGDVDASRVGARARPVPSPTHEQPLEVLQAFSAVSPRLGPLDRLLEVLHDKDDQTKQVLLALHRDLKLTEGDFEYARECASGPGVQSPTRVAVSELQKRAKERIPA